MRYRHTYRYTRGEVDTPISVPLVKLFNHFHLSMQLYHFRQSEWNISLLSGGGCWYVYEILQCFSDDTCWYLFFCSCTKDYILHRVSLSCCNEPRDGSRLFYGRVECNGKQGNNLKSKLPCFQLHSARLQNNDAPAIGSLQQAALNPIKDLTLGTTTVSMRFYQRHFNKITS